MDLNRKKLLILGGTPQHCKLVEAARRLGVYTIVTDYLPDSPAKAICDEAWMLDVKDVEGLAAMCRRTGVDGVISGYIDPCQRPYEELCRCLGLPCYGTQEQFLRMTDKHAFKRMCVENGVDVIPEYTQADIAAGRVEYPVFVKPVDSRGSRGQTVCYSQEELEAAVAFARRESSNGDILIEKYMRFAHEFQVTYFFVEGEPYLIRTVDSYCGSEANHLEKVVACAVSPSKYTASYLSSAHEKVVQMFHRLGLRNGPVFMQGFEDNGTFRFFDPGLRFPGVDYELVYKAVFGADLMEAMVRIALTGGCPGSRIPEDGVWLAGKRCAVLFPTVSAGVVGRIEGVEEIRRDRRVISYQPRCGLGDEIEWAYNVNQRCAEIDVLGVNTGDLRDAVGAIGSALRIWDTEGRDMIFERIAPDVIE